MVNWKVTLVVVIIAALVMAIGMWFGYRYVSEQDDISPEGWRERSNTPDSRFDEPLVFSPFLIKTLQRQCYLLKL